MSKELHPVDSVEEDDFTLKTTEVDEAILVKQAKTDPEAFGKLYLLYVDRIYNYIHHRVGNGENVEELTQETFTRALNKIKEYEDKGAPFSAWLYRIAHNIVANWYRDESPLTKVPIEPRLSWFRSDESNPEKVAGDWQEKEKLRKALRNLHPDRQTLLILKFSEGLSNREIGEIMGRTEGAIKSLYHRTLVELREYFETDNL